MNYKKELAIIEGFLYICGDDGADLKDIAYILEVNDLDFVQKLIAELEEKHKNDELSGLMVQKFAKTRVRLLAKDIYFEYYLKLENIKTEAKLSNAAIEVLTLIAYRGPISKPDVEQIRGVNCDNIFIKLRQRNFIKEAGKSDAPGKPMLYETTTDFLKYFNLNSLEDLPPIKEKEESKDLF